jgi:hypothetical protein
LLWSPNRTDSSEDVAVVAVVVAVVDEVACDAEDVRLVNVRLGLREKGCVVFPALAGEVGAQRASG